MNTDRSRLRATIVGAGGELLCVTGQRVADRPNGSDGLREPGGERRRVVEPLGEQQPRGAMVRQQVVGLVEELERRAGGRTGMLGSDRQRCEQVAQRLDSVVHETDGDVGEDRGLGVGFVDPRQQPIQHLQQHLVDDVEQVGDL